MGKGEIARYEQFLFFPQCFQKACFLGVSKGVIVWEWVNPLPNDKSSDLSEFKALADNNSKNQSVENAGVAFVKGADERNKFFEKINNL